MINYAEWVDEYERELERINAIKDKIVVEYDTAVKTGGNHIEIKYRIAHYKQLISECQATITTLRERAKKYGGQNQ